MVKSKNTKTTPKTPKPKPMPIPLPETIEPSENAEFEISSVIDAEAFKKGFYVRMRKRQMTAKGELFSFLSERIISTELETQQLPDLVHEKCGPGVYRLNLYTMNDKEILTNKKIIIAVGDINKANISQRDTPPLPHRFSGGVQSAAEKLESRSDVLDQKASNEKLRLKVEEEKLNKELKRITGDGSDNNNLDLRIKVAMGEVSDKFTLAIKDIVASLKPAGDSELKKEIADLARKIDANAAAKDNANMYQLMTESNNKMFMWMLENSKNMSASQVDILKQMVDQNSKGKGNPIELYKEFKDMFKLERDIRREDREYHDSFMPGDAAPAEEPFWKGIITGIVDFVRELNKDGLLSQKLANMNNPPVQPQLGRVYTPEEEDRVIKRMVDDAVAKHKKELPAVTATKPADNAATPPATTQAIPAGETPEEFAAKKEAVNNMMALLLKEMVLCPHAPEWMNLAIGKLPDDILIAIRDAADAPGLFSVLEKYADPNLIAELRAKLAADLTAEKKKSAWLVSGFNLLKAEITEMLTPVMGNTATVTPAEVASATPTAGGATTVVATPAPGQN